MYISSASAYHKPLRDYVITEGTALANPYWEYSRNKIACETYLMERYREDQFPVTIIRPSHTYSERSVPMGLHGTKGSYQVMKRMLEGKPVIVHGDGMSLWTMTYNTDFAKGFIGLMGNPHAIGEAFQITSDESMTWNQIYQLIADHLGVPYRPYYVSSDFIAQTSPVSFDARGGLIGDKSNTVVFDNTKLKRMVPDFKATVRMEEGLKKAVDYVMSHPQCQQEDPEFDAWCDQLIEALEQAKAQVIKNSNHEFHSDYADVVYQQKDHAVLITWKKEAHLEHYREPVSYALKLMETYPGSSLVIDARNGFEDDKRDVEWGFSYFIPQMAKTGCKYVSLIMHEVAGAELEEEMDMWTIEFKKYVTVTRGESYEQAVAGQI